MLMFDGRRDAPSIVLRLAVVGLALATAYIHYTLGGMMFMANAAGFLVLAVAMIVPLALASRYRWLVRAALILFTLATIGGWLMFGARYDTAYMATGLELVLIVLLGIEMLRYDGGPAAVVQKAWTLAMSTLHRLTGRSAA